MPEGDDIYDVLRGYRKSEDHHVGELDTVREKISKEVRALHNGAFGRPRSLQEIADAVGASKTAVYNWLRRGSGA